MIIEADDKLIVILEQGIPGPQGDAGNLSLTNIIAPLEYDGATYTLKVRPGSEIGETLEWNGSAWVIAPPRRVESRTVTEAEEIAKEIALSFPVTRENELTFEIYGSNGPQFKDADYTIESGAIAWGGKSLDGVLAAGDLVRVSYR